jgi:hypothetical protein
VDLAFWTVLWLCCKVTLQYSGAAEQVTQTHAREIAPPVKYQALERLHLCFAPIIWLLRRVCIHLSSQGLILERVFAEAEEEPVADYENLTRLKLRIRIRNLRLHPQVLHWDSTQALVSSHPLPSRTHYSDPRNHGQEMHHSIPHNLSPSSSLRIRQSGGSGSRPFCLSETLSTRRRTWLNQCEHEERRHSDM